MDAFINQMPGVTTGSTNAATPNNINASTPVSFATTTDGLNETSAVKIERVTSKAVSNGSPGISTGGSGTAGTTISMDYGTSSLRQRNSIEALEKLDLMPHVQDLLVRVLSGNILVKDVDNEAGSIRVKLAKARSGLRELTDLDETISYRREKISKLQLNIEQKRLLLQQFKHIIDQNRASQPTPSPANEEYSQEQPNNVAEPIKTEPHEIKQNDDEASLDVMDGQMNSVDQAMELDVFDDLTTRNDTSDSYATNSVMDSNNISNEYEGIAIEETSTTTNDIINIGDNNENDFGTTTDAATITGNHSVDTSLDNDNQGMMMTDSLESMGINLDSIPFDEDSSMIDI